MQGQPLVQPRGPELIARRVPGARSVLPEVLPIARIRHAPDGFARFDHRGLRSDLRSPRVDHRHRRRGGPLVRSAYLLPRHFRGRDRRLWPLGLRVGDPGRTRTGRDGRRTTGNHSTREHDARADADVASEPVPAIDPGRDRVHHVVHGHPGARLFERRFSGARLSSARLLGTRFSGARLLGSRLASTRFSGAGFFGAEFFGAGLLGTRFFGGRHLESGNFGSGDVETGLFRRRFSHSRFGFRPDLLPGVVSLLSRFLLIQIILTDQPIQPSLETPRESTTHHPHPHILQTLPRRPRHDRTRTTLTRTLHTSRKKRTVHRIRRQLPTQQITPTDQPTSQRTTRTRQQRARDIPLLTIPVLELPPLRQRVLRHLLRSLLHRLHQQPHRPVQPLQNPPHRQPPVRHDLRHQTRRERTRQSPQHHLTEKRQLDHDRILRMLHLQRQSMQTPRLLPRHHHQTRNHLTQTRHIPTKRTPRRLANTPLHHTRQPRQTTSRPHQPSRQPRPTPRQLIRLGRTDPRDLLTRQQDHADIADQRRIKINRHREESRQA
ncbi:pentapeptide repeat-containing protein [Saccharothrix sp. HUAS TT1]|uniref:pentapeptide repeat-containing protein n=1 Tax=Saccharothrix sp. HUAS TT1 TaxID=3231910 RepID=UPI00345C52E4